MKKLGRKIRIKFIYTDELLKKLLENHSEDFYKKRNSLMEEKFYGNYNVKIHY